MTPSAERLVLEHLSLVEQTAARLMRRMPAWVDADELIGAGQLALVQAANAYRDELPIPFACYARTRVKRAMFDALRRDLNLPTRKCVTTSGEDQ